MGSKFKYIPLHVDTLQSLLKKKKRGESYDLLLNRLMGEPPASKELNSEQEPASSNFPE